MECYVERYCFFHIREKRTKQKCLALFCEAVYLRADSNKIRILDIEL